MFWLLNNPQMLISRKDKRTNQKKQKTNQSKYSQIVLFTVIKDHICLIMSYRWLKKIFTWQSPVVSLSISWKFSKWNPFKRWLCQNFKHLLVSIAHFFLYWMLTSLRNGWSAISIHVMSISYCFPCVNLSPLC